MFVKVNKVLRPDFVLIVFHHLFFTCFFDVDFKGLLGVDLLGLLGGEETGLDMHIKLNRDKDTVSYVVFEGNSKSQLGQWLT